MTALVQPRVRVSELHESGDKMLLAGETCKATALYLSAFSTHAASTMSHMRKLEESSLDGVISTLECWLDSPEDSQTAEGLNKGLVAVFLSTLCPNNLSATIFKIESLLQSGGLGCEEIFARCTAVLGGKRNPRPGTGTGVLLEITRALACLFSVPHSMEGVKLYLRAYQNNKHETVKLVKSRQAAHLPKIVGAFTEQIRRAQPCLTSDGEYEATREEREKVRAEAAAEMLDFLLTLSPADRDIQELHAAHLFTTGRFEDSAEVYSSILQQRPENSTDDTIQDQPEWKARLLTSHAAACFSAGGRLSDACRDLGGAFESHPACARLYFQKLFSHRGTGMAAQNHLRQQAERGLSAYKEKVLIRPDLRSTEGMDLLDPAISQLRTLCHLEPDGGGRELRVRLAECLLLRGEHKEALSICSQLAAAKGQQSYQNTVQVFRGYARLLTDDHKGALEDFQAVIEHNAPHPSSCVRALCGRGLLRMMGGFNYLTALDYVTSSRLQQQETALTIRCLVPWNSRGLLVTVLLEQGRIMLEGSGTSENSQQLQERDRPLAASKRDDHRAGYDVGPTYDFFTSSHIIVLALSAVLVHAYPLHNAPSTPSHWASRTPAGVHSLAVLLMELQPTADGPQILAADALYQLGRVEEAYRLLLSIRPSSPRAPILARLTLLQLHRGFLYDTNQVYFRK